MVRNTINNNKSKELKEVKSKKNIKNKSISDYFISLERLGQYLPTAVISGYCRIALINASIYTTIQLYMYTSHLPRDRCTVPLVPSLALALSIARSLPLSLSNIRFVFIFRKFCCSSTWLCLSKHFDAITIGTYVHTNTDTQTHRHTSMHIYVYTYW